MESRQNTKAYNLLNYAVVMGFTLFAILMFVKVLPYLGFDKGIDFLSTKTDETQVNIIFRIGFYIHITTAMVVLAVGLPQFIPYFVRTYPSVHRVLGKVYVVGILLLAAASGMVLAVFANGGLPAKTGFAMQCIVWWLATYMAYAKVMKQQYRQHIAWMIRSFAITLAAFSLRSETYLMDHFLHTKPIETYITITWLSWVGNLLIAEILINAGLDKYLHAQILKAKS